MANPIDSKIPAPSIKETIKHLDAVTAKIKKEGRSYAVLENHVLTTTQSPEKASRLKDIKAFVSSSLESKEVSLKELESLEKSFKEFVKYYQTQSGRDVQININRIINPNSRLGKIIAKVISFINRQLPDIFTSRASNIHSLSKEILLRAFNIEQMINFIAQARPVLFSRAESAINKMNKEQLLNLLSLIALQTKYQILSLNRKPTKIQFEICEKFINKHLEKPLTNAEMEDCQRQVDMVNQIFSKRPQLKNQRELIHMNFEQLERLSSLIDLHINAPYESNSEHLFGNLIDLFLQGDEPSLESIEAALAKKDKIEKKEVPLAQKSVHWNEKDTVYGENKEEINVPTNPTDRSGRMREGILSRSGKGADISIKERLLNQGEKTYIELQDLPKWMNKILDDYMARLEDIGIEQTQIKRLKLIVIALLDHAAEEIEAGKRIDIIKFNMINAFEKDLNRERLNSEELEETKDAFATVINPKLIPMAIFALQATINQFIDWPKKVK